MDIQTLRLEIIKVCHHPNKKAEDIIDLAKKLEAYINPPANKPATAGKGQAQPPAINHIQRNGPARASLSKLLN